MSSVRFLNQQNPFWDFLAGLDRSNANHPFFNAYNPESREPRGPPPEYGWTGPPGHQDGPPPQDDGPPASSAEHEDPPSPPPPGPQDHPFGPGFPFAGRRGGSRHGGHHGHHAGPHSHERSGGWGGRGRGWGGRGGWRGGERGPNPCGPAGNFDMSQIAEFISQFVPEEVLSHLGPKDAATASKDAPAANGKDFTPPADIFDTTDAYIVHISLPGAKKEDVGVNWDADKSELNVAGVIYRPGDEEFLKTLALDERKVGVFDRKVKLGSKANPANVDSDAISAKMEDGVLLVTIPKTEEFVDVKKVDIE